MTVKKVPKPAAFDERELMMVHERQRSGVHNYMEYLKSRGELPEPKCSDSEMYDSIMYAEAEGRKRRKK